MVPMIASAMVLNSSRGKSIRSQTSSEVAPLRRESQTGSSVRHEPCQVMAPASGSAGSMNRSPGARSTSASSLVVPSIGTW